MRDSTAFADDAGRLLDEIRTEGYALIRGLVDRDAALEVEHDIRTTMAKHGFTTYADDEETVLRCPAKGRETPDYWAMYSEVLGLESMNSLPYRTRLLDTMRLVLGPTAFTYPMKTVRLVFPRQQGGAAIPIHRDNRGGPWVRDMFTTWVALGDIDSVMGGFAMLRGSQTYRYEAINEEDKVVPGSSGEPIPDMDSPEWVTTEWQPGDVVLFHCYTAHRGIYNRSSRVRVSADYRWQATDHPVEVSALMPYHFFDQHPHIPGWDELTAAWEEKHWCGYPEDVPITDDKWPSSYGFDVPPSKFVDVIPGAQEAWRKAVRDKENYRVSYELPRPSSANA